MLGNEAIARGAYEAGVRVSSAYPGTPSTEINENIALYKDDIYAEWAPNEKVAVEVAIGAAIQGARSMACMKHVGLNVAADPFYTAAYTGLNAGMVIIVADDPGMHSSQNEQDTRLICRAAHVPCLEPSNSQECKDFMRLGYEISEAYDTPVVLRITTRVAHARGVVELNERTETPLRDYNKDRKFISMPANMIARHVFVEKREKELIDAANNHPANVIEWGDKKVGVVTSGAAYNYVKEALPEASVLKLGLVYPLPRKLIEEFAAQVEELYAIEDMEPFFENQMKSWGIRVSGKDKTGVQGELFARKIAAKFAGEKEYGPMNTQDIPVRPPVLCPGCPHRGLYYLLSKLHLTVCSDIGCYTLGALAPLNAVDTTVCMGASIGMAHGFEKARGKEQAKKTVAVLGDSTFCHSGITGLLNMAYNRSVGTVIIADNSITGMTGHQNNPANGFDIYGNPAPALDIVKLCEAMGINNVRVVDPYDLPEMEKALREETARDELSVIVSRRPCALIVKQKNKPFVNDPEKCKNCGMCMKIGCPAIIKAEKGVRIDDTLCVGCGLCAKVCKFGALCEKGE